MPNPVADQAYADAAERIIEEGKALPMRPQVLRRLEVKQHEHDLLVAIWLHGKVSHRRPSIRELREMVGLSSTSEVARYLRKLRDGGAIAMDAGIDRSVRLSKRLAFVTTDEGVTVYEHVGDLR